MSEVLAAVNREQGLTAYAAVKARRDVFGSEVTPKPGTAIQGRDAPVGQPADWPTGVGQELVAQQTSTDPQHEETMNEREALCRAILASPDDELPRLVYCDWLEERGVDTDATHAAFIRANPVTGMTTLSTQAVVTLVRRGCSEFQAAAGSMNAARDAILARRDAEPVQQAAFRQAVVEIVLEVVARYQPLLRAALNDLARRAEAGDTNPGVRDVYHTVVRVAGWPRRYGLPDLQDSLDAYWGVVRDRTLTPRERDLMAELKDQGSRVSPADLIKMRRRRRR